MRKGILLILLSAFFIITIKAQIQEEQKIISGERKIDAQFGSVVDIYMDYAIVGEPYSHTDENLTDSIKEAGAAYIFKKDNDGNWVRTQKLVAPDRETRGYFGYDVAIYDTTVLIGSGKNKVYVFEKNTEDVWVYKQTISDADGQEFGLSLSMHNNYAIIGDTYAWGTFSGGYQYPAGAAYIYERDETGVWVKSKKVMASDYAKYDNFGGSVDIFNDYAIVGNSSHNNSRGTAYLFQRSDAGVWNEVQKLEASSLESGDAYGKTVAIYDSVVVVGSIGESYDAEGTNYMASAGAVYMYYINSGDTCAYSEKIVAPVRDTKWAYFGNAIDLNNNYLVVGSGKEAEDSNNENTLTDAGAAYVFERNSSEGWDFNLKVTPSDRVQSDLFGNDIAIYMENFIVGAPQGDLDLISEDSISNAGCSYIYELQTLPNITEQPTDQNDVCSRSETVFSVVGRRIENYQWNVSTNAGDTWTSITNDTVYSGATSNILTIKTNTNLNNNQYYCVVSNSYGTLNSDTVSLTTAVDTEDPVITSTHENLVVYVDANCEAGLPDYTGDIVATDNCDTDLDITQSPLAGTTVSGATNTVTLTVTDDAGNTAEVSFNVAVEDNTAPVISSTHNDVTIPVSSGCEAVLPSFSGELDMADNCDQMLTVLQSPLAGTTISGTTNEVTLTVGDLSGNKTYVSFNVAVVDTMAPTISCLENQTVIVGDNNYYTVTGTEFDPASSGDNCEIASIVNSFNNLSSLDGAQFPTGTTTITWTVTDKEGNETSCIFDVTVNNATTSITTLQQSGISIYPNPTKGIINLDNSENNIQRVTISDISGKLVLDNIETNKLERIDLSGLKNGIYLLSIQTDKKVLTTRIIKE